MTKFTSQILFSFFQPFNATRIPASGLENRVKQLEKEKEGQKTKGGFWDEFEVTITFITPFAMRLGRVY